MPRLLHHPLDPNARFIRLCLDELGLTAELQEEKAWHRRDELLALNPAGELPVLVADDGAPICGAGVIAEYLHEDGFISKNGGTGGGLLPGDAADRAEIRRLMHWFLVKFAREVTDNLLGEKLIKRLAGTGTPRTDVLRAGGKNIGYHLDYIGYLTDRRTWLGGDQLSLADLAAAAQLSCLDYLGDVPWESAHAAKLWYARLKSRPSFQPLFADRVPGVTPPKHYADPDF